MAAAYTLCVASSSGARHAKNVQGLDAGFADGLWPVGTGDSRGEVCGYFKPYAWGLQGEHNGVKAMDKDGNSNLEIALLIANEERKKKKENAKRYSEYINYHTPIKIKDLRTNEYFYQTPANHLSRGRGNQLDKDSSGERLVRSWIMKNNIDLISVRQKEKVTIYGISKSFFPDFGCFRRKTSGKESSLGS